MEGRIEKGYARERPVMNLVSLVLPRAITPSLLAPGYERLSAFRYIDTPFYSVGELGLGVHWDPPKS